MQLQLLDLMIPKECDAVRMDAATRADLIDLMARVLAAVFHEEGRTVNDTHCPISSLRSAKDLQGSTMKRVKGVEDLKILVIGTQGILGVGVITRMPIV